MKHDELAQDLARHLMATQNGPMVWTDMQLGPSGSPRPDVYVIPKTYTALRPMIYEVKVSVSDFRADVTAGKWQSYRPMCAGIYFAFPSDLAIKPEDVPAECGIIRRSAETGAWRAARKPVLRPVENMPAHVWQKLLIDGVNRAQHAHRVEAANKYALIQRVRQRLGEEVGNYLCDAMQARSVLDQIKAGTHYELELARQSAQRQVKEAQDRAEYNLRTERAIFARDVNEVCQALGLPAGSDAKALAMRMRQALMVITGDMHAIERARTQLTAANDVLAGVVDLVESISKKQGVQHA